MMARLIRTGRLASASAYILVALGALVMVTAPTSCTQRALIAVDVVGDTPFQNITLRLTTSTGTSKDFARASFTADMPFKAGLYVDDSANTVTITARAIDDSGGCLGIGMGAATGVSAGAATAPVKITVAHSSSCTSAPTGAGGGDEGGTGGVTSGAGGSDTGAGGMIGGAGGNNGGVGGTNGTGGQPGTNLVTNGDFSNGEDSWGIKAGSGTVAISGGTYCVTITSAPLTIGYPAGTTPPIQLNAGTTYRFSYQASISSSNTTLTARVGQTQMPYDAPGSEWPGEPVGATLQTFTHTFTRASSDSSMGVAFNVMGGPSTVCIDNVTLAPN